VIDEASTMQPADQDGWLHYITEKEEEQRVGVNGSLAGCALCPL